MIGLTTRQQDLLDFIRFYQADSEGVSPSVREMAAAVEAKSTGRIHQMLVALEERGLIRRLPNRARAIEIINQRPDLTNVTTDDLLSELARRGVTTLQPGLVTTRPALLPGPSIGTQQTDGPGLSHQPFHEAEIAHA